MIFIRLMYVVLFCFCLGCIPRNAYPLGGKRKDVWNRFTHAYDSTGFNCSGVKLPSTKSSIKVLGHNVNLNGTFKIKYKNYAIRGTLLNGVPNGKWLYINLTYCIIVDEVFLCGAPLELGHYTPEDENCIIFAKDFGLNVTKFKKINKKHRYEHYDIVKGIRNKIHGEIYQAQFKK